MSAFGRSVPPDREDLIARAVDAVRMDLEPDPLYARRLRSQVLNRYVAAREEAAPTTASPETGRLGRSVLSATVVLGVSATGVLAASQEALPGELLYLLKREVELLRHEILPAALEPMLARDELIARLDELEQVAGTGDATMTDALAQEIGATYAELVAAEVPPDSQTLVVIEELVEQLPSPAQAVVQDVVADIDDAAVARTEAPEPSPDLYAGRETRPALPSEAVGAGPRPADLADASERAVPVGRESADAPPLPSWRPTGSPEASVTPEAVPDLAPGG